MRLLVDCKGQDGAASDSRSMADAIGSLVFLLFPSSDFRLNWGTGKVVLKCQYLAVTNAKRATRFAWK